MISASHTRRFCIVLGAAIVLAFAASATSDDVPRSCNPDHNGAITPSGGNVVNRVENVDDCVENHTASRIFFGAEKLNAR